MMINIYYTVLYLIVITRLFYLWELITNWAKLFVKLFQKYSPSDLKLPKLHNWRYHVITTIKEYGAINSFTTETYETLHKDAVKKPYRASNKRQPTDQMIKDGWFYISCSQIICMTNINFSLCIGLSKCNFKILASTNGCKTTLSKNTYERLVGNIFFTRF